MSAATANVSTLAATNAPTTSTTNALATSTEDNATTLPPSPFKSFYQNQSLLPPKNKIRLILSCAIAGIIEGFSLEVLKGSSPWSQ